MNKKFLLCLLPAFLLCGCDAPSDNGSRSGSDGKDNPSNNDSTGDDAQKEFLEWFKSDDAIDIDADGDIDEKDFDLYKGYNVWREDPKNAKDYNGDRKINEDDYLFYVRLKEWEKSDESEDFNDDDEIDEEDYQIYLEYSKWLESDDAEDLNSDRKINYKDYLIFKNPESNEYLNWKETSDAKDYNKDGKVDRKDYVIFNYFGSYQIRNYTYSGTAIYLEKADINLKTIGYDLLNNITFKYDKNGLKIIANDVVKNRLGSSYEETMEELSHLKLNISTDTTFNISLSSTFNTIDFDLIMYFTKGDNGYHTNYHFAVEDCLADIEFDLVKI